MKKTIKNILLVLLGFVLCYGLVWVLTWNRAKSYRQESLMPVGIPEDLSSDQEVIMRSRVYSLFMKDDVGALSEILKVEKGDVGLEVSGASLFPESHTPGAVVVLRNRSDRSLTIFEPQFKRLTQKSYNYEGYLQDDFSISCPLTRKGRCHILLPKATLSIPVLFHVAGLGVHKINLSIGFPVISNISASRTSSSSTVLARLNYIFEITGEKAKEGVSLGKGSVLNGTGTSVSPIF